MYFTVKVVATGDGYDISLPYAVAAKLKVSDGHTLTLKEVPEGFVLTSLKPDALDQLAVGRQVMRKWRGALAELAKR